MAEKLILGVDEITNSSNELSTLSTEVSDLCKTMYDEIKELKETKEFKTLTASELYFQTIDDLNNVVPKYTDDVLKFSEFLSNYVLTNYSETDQDIKQQVESELEESLAQLEGVNELGNGVNLDKISSSAQGALNGEFIDSSKLQKSVFQDGELEFKVRDDGSVQIIKNGTVLGYTTQDGVTNGNMSAPTETAPVTQNTPVEQASDANINQVAQASTLAGGGLAAAATQTSPSGATYTSLGTPPVDSTFKAYMGYGSLTNKSSKQYAMQHSENCYTDDAGFRRYKEDGTDYYMVALGSHYTGGEVGKKYRITLDSGQQFYAIAGDQKADIHTDPTNMYRDTGTTTNVVEFIVDTSKISSSCKSAGSMSGANGGQFEGNVTDIELIS